MPLHIESSVLQYEFYLVVVKTPLCSAISTNTDTRIILAS